MADSSPVASDDLPGADIGNPADDVPMSASQHHQFGSAYLGQAHEALNHAAAHFGAAAPAGSGTDEPAEDAGPADTGGDDSDQRAMPARPQMPGVGKASFAPGSGAAKSLAALKRGVPA
jgi:hypothetical protein